MASVSKYVTIKYFEHRQILKRYDNKAIVRLLLWVKQLQLVKSSVLLGDQNPSLFVLGEGPETKFGDLYLRIASPDEIKNSIVDATGLTSYRVLDFYDREDIVDKFKDVLPGDKLTFISPVYWSQGSTGVVSLPGGPGSILNRTTLVIERVYSKEGVQRLKLQKGAHPHVPGPISLEWLNEAESINLDVPSLDNTRYFIYRGADLDTSPLVTYGKHGVLTRTEARTQSVLSPFVSLQFSSEKAAEAMVGLIKSNINALLTDAFKELTEALVNVDKYHILTSTLPDNINALL